MRKRFILGAGRWLPAIAIGFCLFLSFLGLALVYGLPYILPYIKS